MIFENIDIDPDSLPNPDSSTFIPLEKKYKTVLIIKAILFSFVVMILFLGYVLYFSKRFPDFIRIILLVLLVLSVSLNILFAILGFKRKKYKVRLHDIIYKTGLLWRSETSIPFVRIQHSEVIQGPIDRLFGLSVLRLYTAGGHSSDLSIPGLSHFKAEKLKDFIVNRIQEEEE